MIYLQPVPSTNSVYNEWQENKEWKRGVEKN